MREYDFPTFTGFEDPIVDRRIRQYGDLYLAMELENGTILPIPYECLPDGEADKVLDAVVWAGFVMIIAEHPSLVVERYHDAHDQWNDIEYNKTLDNLN
jgi:hypothetical protein